MTCLSLGLSAQQHRKNSRPMTSAEQAEKRVERMAEILSLTEQQKKQVSQLALEGASRQEELQKKRKEEVESQKKYRLAQEEKIEAILTNEQKERWEQHKESRPLENGRHEEREHLQRRRPGFSKG